MAKAKEKHQCCKMVWDDTRWPRQHQCSRAGSVERDGQWYCKQHDPVAVKEKSEARDAAWRDKWDTERKQAENAIRLQLATKAILATCQQLLDWRDANLVESDSLSILLRDLRMSVCEFEQASK